jgi:hypothetical protein
MFPVNSYCGILQIGVGYRLTPETQKRHRPIFPSKKLEAVEWGSEPNVNPQADLLTAHHFADGHTAARCTRSASAIAPLLTPETQKGTG